MWRFWWLKEFYLMGILCFFVDSICPDINKNIYSTDTKFLVYGTTKMPSDGSVDILKSLLVESINKLNVKN